MDNSCCRPFVDYMVETYGYDEVLNECMLHENFKGAVIGLALMGTLGYGMLKNCLKSDNFTPMEKERIETIVNKNKITPDDIPGFNAKVEAVNKYMVDAMKQRYGYKKDGNGRPRWENEYDKITLSPEHIVLACAKYKYDLPLLLATAKVESMFGTTPRCYKGTRGNPPTNSVFSVGSVDTGANWNYYKSADASVEPYIKLMLKNYLVDKSVEDVLHPGKLVNTIGKRYASDTKYESTLKSQRNKIIRNYPDLADTTETTWNLDVDFDNA